MRRHQAFQQGPQKYEKGEAEPGQVAGARLQQVCPNPAK